MPTLMNEWTLKVQFSLHLVPGARADSLDQIGYPVLTVKETDSGIVVRQDRFLDTGDVKEDENQTIWYASSALDPSNIDRVQACAAPAADYRCVWQGER